MLVLLLRAFQCPCRRACTAELASQRFLGPRGADADGLGAAQRGDAEMAQKLWRVVRACVELGSGNPIQQIHDQGAGGNCNVVRAALAVPLRPACVLALVRMLWLW